MTMNSFSRRYSELIRYPTFEERLEYLRLSSIIGDSTFGFDRWINQEFYHSKEWREARREIIIRDSGCDLGIEDRPIAGRIEIHHINPVSLDNIETSSDILFSPENLICVSPATHKLIHYGGEAKDSFSFVERKPNDTCPWKMKKGG